MKIKKWNPIWYDKKAGTYKISYMELVKPVQWRKKWDVLVNNKIVDMFNPDIPSEYIAAVFGIMSATYRSMWYTHDHTYVIETSYYTRYTDFVDQMRSEAKSSSLHLDNPNSRCFTEAADYLLDYYETGYIYHLEKEIDLKRDWPLHNIKVKEKNNGIHNF